MPFQWVTNPVQVMTQAFEEVRTTWKTRVNIISGRTAREIEEWMKQNAIWDDRTGQARATLFAEVQGLALNSSILIGYGVSYGFWLEYAHAGEYAIIGPALDHWAPVLFDRIQAEIRKPA